MDFVSLALTGAVVSLVVQLIKSTVGTSRLWTVATVVVLSVLAGGIWYAVRDNVALVEAATQILLVANAVYGFFISYFEEA